MLRDSLVCQPGASETNSLPVMFLTDLCPNASRAAGALTCACNSSPSPGNGVTADIGAGSGQEKELGFLASEPHLRSSISRQASDPVLQLAVLPRLSRLEFGHHWTVLENDIYSSDMVSNDFVRPRTSPWTVPSNLLCHTSEGLRSTACV